MSPEDFIDAQKALRLAEENQLREIDIKIDKLHKSEEADLRAELEKKHAQEQIDYKQRTAKQQMKLRVELLGEDAMKDPEVELERKNLEKYTA